MTPARAYMTARAIDPRIAHELGVKLGRNANELLYPNNRLRFLAEGKTIQLCDKCGRAKYHAGCPEETHREGMRLKPWWLAPPERARWAWVLVCEGESDALAVRSYLPYAVESSGLRSMPILCTPGTGYPVERLCADLARKTREALIATDPDEAGKRFAREAAGALVEVGVRPVRIEVPEPDLAGWLAGMPESHRPHRLADTLIDFKDTAPTLLDHEREKQIAYHRTRLAELEAA